MLVIKRRWRRAVFFLCRCCHGKAERILVDLFFFSMKRLSLSIRVLTQTKYQMCTFRSMITKQQISCVCLSSMHPKFPHMHIAGMHASYSMISEHFNSHPEWLIVIFDAVFGAEGHHTRLTRIFLFCRKSLKVAFFSGKLHEVPMKLSFRRAFIRFASAWNIDFRNIYMADPVEVCSFNNERNDKVLQNPTILDPCGYRWRENLILAKINPL